MYRFLARKGMKDRMEEDYEETYTNQANNFSDEEEKNTSNKKEIKK